MPTSTWTLRVRDFHALALVEWSPQGVCLLAGPNGAGKTTLLRAFRFLRELYARGMAAALQSVGGARGLRRIGAPEDGPVTFELEVDDLKWQVQVPIEGAGVHEYYGEVLTRGSEVVLRAGMYQAEWHLGAEARGRDARCGLRVLRDKQEPPWLQAFVDRLYAIRIYDALDTASVVRPRGGDEENVYLNSRGRNLIFVLRNWAAAPRRFNDQFAWVQRGVRDAFPELIDTLEFEGDEALFYPPGSAGHEGLPLHLAADGLLTGLLHLTAVAGAKPGSLIAIDEMENQLHPYAIRTLFGAIRELAEARGLTVILTTHSPVLMNAFKGDEDQFYVLERDSTEAQPRRLSELREPEWLAHFMLGSLYERGLIGAQRAPTE